MPIKKFRNRMNKYFVTVVTVFACLQLTAQPSATISVDLNKPGATISPSLHGIFFEEISHGGEGGLYGELIQNRGFEESRLPEGTTLEDGFIVPKRTPHYNLNGRATNWKMPWTLKTEWPYWKLEKEDNAAI